MREGGRPTKSRATSPLLLRLFAAKSDVGYQDGGFFSLRRLAEIWALENYQLRNRPNVEKLICINHKP